MCVSLPEWRLFLATCSAHVWAVKSLSPSPLNKVEISVQVPQLPGLLGVRTGEVCLHQLPEFLVLPMMITCLISHPALASLSHLRYASDGAQTKEHWEGTLCIPAYTWRCSVGGEQHWDLAIGGGFSACVAASILCSQMFKKIEPVHISIWTSLL